MAGTRTLTVTSDSGLCNRLRVLLSGKAIADATQREFAMLWEPTTACGAGFDQLFENAWNVRADILFDERGAYQFAQYSWNEMPDLLCAPQTHLCVQNYGWLYQPTRHAHHAALEPNVIALMLALSPIPPLQERIKRFRENHFRSRMIGAHVRRGDMVTWRPDTAGDLMPTVQAIDKFLEESPDAGILLCTDDGSPHPYTGRPLPTQGIVAKMVARYGTRVVCTQARLERSSQTAIEDAVVDLFLLRSADYFVGTLSSSFSELARFGRSIPFVLAEGKTPAYQKQERWLQRLGLVGLVERWAYEEYGRQVPYTFLFLKYRNRVRHRLRQNALRRKRMKLMMRVQVVSAEDPRKKLPGLKVALYDRDWKSEDDLLGTEVSDAKGEIFFEFDEKKYKDGEDGPDWRAESLPDLYVNILDAEGKVVYSTREVVERDRFPKILVVPIPEYILQQHNLLP